MIAFDRPGYGYSARPRGRVWFRAPSRDQGDLAGLGIHDLMGHGASLLAPTVIIAGEADKVVDPDDARALHRQLPHNVLRVVPGAGHMVHYGAIDHLITA